MLSATDLVDRWLPAIPSYELCGVVESTGEEALPRSRERALRIVTIAAEAPGAQYFVVEPNGAQLAALRRRTARPAHACPAPGVALPGVLDMCLSAQSVDHVRVVQFEGGPFGSDAGEFGEVVSWRAGGNRAHVPIGVG